MPKQFALPLSLDVVDSFANFYIGDSAERGICVESIKMQFEPAGDFLIYLWGSPSSGRSHLLKATAHWRIEQGAKVSFFHASQIKQDPSSLNDIAYTADLVLIDDVDQLLGDISVETALFAAYNALRDNGKKLIVTANSSPRELQCALADLASRLSWGGVFRTVALSDEELMHALIQRSAARGIALESDVAQFILNHSKRDAGLIFDALDELDAISLERQRKLTIPFVKTIMQW